MNKHRLNELKKYELLKDVKNYKLDFWKHYIFENQHRLSFNTIIYCAKDIFGLYTLR